MRSLFLATAFIAFSGVSPADEPAAPVPVAPAPATEAKPAGTPPAEKPEGLPATTRMTVADFLKTLPGTWSGEQRMLSPKKQVMTMRVTQTYRLETRDKVEGIVGELECVIGTGQGARSFRSTSFIWMDAQGRGHSEVVQGGKTERYDAMMSQDTLVFLPESKSTGPGAKRERPESGTGIRRDKDVASEFLVVKGFQSASDGLYLVEGKLIRTK